MRLKDFLNEYSIQIDRIQLIINVVKKRYKYFQWII